MWAIIKQWLLYPLARFVFEFLGDHLWVAAVLVLLIVILVWRFCWPVVLGFYKLFGWQGFALLGAALVTFGAFGAGWRAHRDESVSPGGKNYYGDKPVKPPKIPRKPAPEPSEDDYWNKVTHGIPIK